MTRKQQIYVRQFASGVADFSSQYGSDAPRSFSYSMQNIVGEPKIFPRYGDFTQSAVMRTYGGWWNDDKKDFSARPKSTEFCSEDYIDLIFEQAVYPWSIAIYETFNPGAVVRILAYCEHFPDHDIENMDSSDATNLDLHKKLIAMPCTGSANRWRVLWQGNPLNNNRRKEAQVFAPVLNEIRHRTRFIRIEFCHSCLDYYTGIDAVELIGTLKLSLSSSVDPLPMSLIPVNVISDVITDLTNVAESKMDVSLSPKRDDVTMKSDVTKRWGADYFSLLPVEVLEKIFGFLPLPDLFNAAKVCRSFRYLSYDGRFLRFVQLRPYWHRADSNLLNCLQIRFPRVLPNQINPKNDHRYNSLLLLDMGWLGGGDVINSDQMNRFLLTTNTSHLTTLSVTSSQCVDDDTVKIVTSQCAMLRHLDVGSCEKPTEEGLRCLGDLRRLETVNLYRTKVDDAGVIWILQNNGQLKKINIGSCLKIADYDRIFEEIAAYCPNIESIDVWRAKTLTYRGIRFLTTSCKNVKHLDLGWCNGVTSSTRCFHLVAKLHKLRRLLVTANRTICDDDVTMIADNCPHLQQLDILGTRLVTRRSIDHLLLKTSNLTFLDLSYCHAFNRSTVQQLRTQHPAVHIKMGNL